jgi:hypothetical protein
MKRPLALAAIVMLAAGLLATMHNASAATNLINNPSAETIGDDGMPVGWHGDVWGENDAWHSVSNRAKSGRRSLLVEVESYTWGDAKWYFDPVDVQPNAEYTFTDWYRSDISTYATLDVTKADGTHEYFALGGADPSPRRYRKFTATFTTPADAVKATVFHSIPGLGFLRTDKYSLVETGGQGEVPPQTDAPVDAPSAPDAPEAPEAPETPAPAAPSTPATPDLPAPAGYPMSAGSGSFVSTLGVGTSKLPFMNSPSLLWNKRLPADAPLDPNSASQAAVIARSARDGGGMPMNNPGIFEDSENAPQVYVVDSDQTPFVPVRFACSGASSWWNYNAGEFENYINNAYPGKYGVPIPANVKQFNDARNSDSPLAIYDYKHDVQFNFWVFNGSDGNYTACWGGHIGGQYTGIKDAASCNAMNTPATFSQGDGTFCYPFGEDTAGFSDLGTNITLEEARSGVINHAISISVPHVREGGFSYPATRMNGWCDSMGISGAIGGSQNCLYVGQRLRLPADFDTSTIANPFTRAVAEAAKNYGFIVHDTAGCICIQSESGSSVTSNGGANPWDGIYGSGGNKGAFDAFPWESLQVVAKDYRW